MRYLTPSILFALAVLCCVFSFLLRYVRAARAALDEPGREESRRLTFAGTCHPMERRDRLPVLLITLIYAATAFFQLGDTTAPQTVCEFADGGAVAIEISGDPVCATGIRYYSGLGTGEYNIEISEDGEHWSTLWQRKDDPNDSQKVTGYYWADAEGYSPSYALTQKYNQLYKWIDVTVENPRNVRYLRITGRADKANLQLSKLCLLGEDGQPVSFSWTMADGSAVPEELISLFCVDSTVPEKSTWHNSTYFDEIYHARTAKEHIDGVYPYEVTHPPLGKLILGIGIRLFGMTPFGWRFMGTLFGVLMLPILYAFLKNMFGRTPVAACGTILFAADFMHLTQTRIATIDTYAVFFILCMYWFLYRYLTLPAGTPFRKGALPLFLSGLFWGLGVASKWTVIYAGAGLAILYFIGFYQKLRDWPAEGQASRTGWIVKTLLFSVLCFIVIPFFIYCASYLPYAQAMGVDLSLSATLDGARRSFPVLFQNLWGKFTLPAGEFSAASIPTDSLPGIVANNQWYMLTYHEGVHASHPYSSWWFQWLVDGRPILYYMDNSVAGYTTRFAAFSNPAVCWAGLGAILICGAHSFRRTWSKAAFLSGLGVMGAYLCYHVGQTENGVFDPAQEPETLTRNLILLFIFLLLYLILAGVLLRAAPGHSEKAAFLFTAYLSQLVPWMFIGRITFEYHYFPSILFLVFAVSYLFNGLLERDPAWKKPVYGLTGLAVGLYALFYPVLIGLTIPTWYEPLVKWIESWPF